MMMMDENMCSHTDGHTDTLQLPTALSKYGIYLGRDGYVTAGPDGAQASLSIQLTLSIVVGDARGHSHPTAS